MTGAVFPAPESRNSGAPVFIVGCGYVGHRVAVLEQACGAKVLALARSDRSAGRLRALDIQPVPGDLDRPDSLSGLSVGGALVYYLAPPPPDGAGDPRIEAFLAAAGGDRRPVRLVLVSTTGVYGDCGGDWVTEDRPPRPMTDRARRRLSAENALRRWAAEEGVGWAILRVPGIYGPGRLPVQRLRAGEPVLRHEDSPFSNRIHADDLARACVAAGHSDSAGRIFNVSDGSPGTMTEFFFEVADFLGIPRPSAVSREEAGRVLGPGMLSYLAESKRIDSRRIREELGWAPLYPDLGAGLPASLNLTAADAALMEGR